MVAEGRIGWKAMSSTGWRAFALHGNNGHRCSLQTSGISFRLPDGTADKAALTALDPPVPVRSVWTSLSVAACQQQLLGNASASTSYTLRPTIQNCRRATWIYDMVQPAKPTLDHPDSRPLGACHPN